MIDLIAMISNLVIVGLAFGWLFYETKFLTARLLIETVATTPNTDAQKTERYVDWLTLDWSLWDKQTNFTKIL